ncbi:hypothetical protein [Cohnella boryungensis]|uniref:Uncharacterized protein n=1 Tax=Cohnella boryungensis TaxID=768479 RepID=A0ABV8SCZ7_9BACL
MESEQAEYTVEYQDTYGVVYYRNVKASDIAEAKALIRQGNPDVVIRAATIFLDNTSNKNH